ncbi:diphthine synthase [Candidatus Woesearchaeota archaeon]|nr:MAG: diphthine synthase [Candidatus Woesearchaeota archaeon]
MLILIGLGLGDHTDITLKGLERVKKADKVYLDEYTSRFEDSARDLENFYGKKVIRATRDILESERLVEEAKKENIVLLVVGDALSATTHIDLLMQAKKENIEVEVIHNASILTAIGTTGLQLYKFGKTTSIPFWKDNYKPENFYEVLQQNKSIGAHTLMLLDITPERCMTIKEAIELLLKTEEKRKEKIFDKTTLCIGCARIGSADQKIKAGTAEELMKEDFGEPLHCLIVPGELHFVEEEAITFLR